MKTPILYSSLGLVALASFANAQDDFTEEQIKLASQIGTVNREKGTITSTLSKYVNSKSEEERKAITSADVINATRYNINQISKKAIGLVDWQGCECKAPVVLTQFDFENLNAGQSFTSVAPSATATGISSTDISGPGSGIISDDAGSNFGCFGGFGSTAAGDGDGSIGFTITNAKAATYCLSDFTFDYYAESNRSYYGPTEFTVEILDGNGSLLFVSDTVSTSGTSSSNIGSFSMFGQQGLAGDPSFDWLEFAQGDSLTFNIVGTGAEQLGLDIDNVMVTACPVPEPSSSLLILLGSSFMLLRRKK
ncbi:MAG: PEP-CTERM sorting domain-containing protein [Akkermansiaceae bacterium]